MTTEGSVPGPSLRESVGTTEGPRADFSVLLPEPSFRPAREVREEEGDRIFPLHPPFFRWLEAMFSPARVTLLSGPPFLVEALLPPLLVAPAGRGRWISLRLGPSRFSPYALASLAREWHYPVMTVLEHIRLARAFTIHQMVNLVEGWGLTLGRLPRHPAFLALLDPFSLFADPEVPEEEGRTLLSHVLERGQRWARASHLPLLLTAPSEGPTGFLRNLCGVTEVLRLRSGPRGTARLEAVHQGSSIELILRRDGVASLEEFDPALGPEARALVDLRHDRPFAEGPDAG
jgi:hypothetical protein